MIDNFYILLGELVIIIVLACIGSDIYKIRKSLEKTK